MQRPDPKDLELVHESNGTDAGARGRFAITYGGRTYGELVYVHKEPKLIVVLHTEIDPTMGGLGLGRKLLMAAVEWARQTGTKAQARCSFARAQFQKDESIRDVYDAG